MFQYIHVVVMKTVRPFILYSVLHFTFAKNVQPSQVVKEVLEHNAYGYFGNIGIPRAEKLYEEEDFQYLRPRIVGGVAADISRFKYQAGLIVTITNSSAIGLCGGALISPNRVATAAHCWFDGVHQGACMTVVLGSAEVFSGGTRIQACEVHVHPKWNPSFAANDVAVVYLPSRVTFSDTIGPVVLPSKHEMNATFEGEVAVASGFGRIGQQIPVTINQSLSEVNLTVISNEECAEKYPTVISAGILCTSGNGSLGHVAICSGDSGGPLVLRRKGKKILIGVSSFGSQLGCDVSMPNGFARVTAHMKFFESHMK